MGQSDPDDTPQPPRCWSASRSAAAPPIPIWKKWPENFAGIAVLHEAFYE
jgi:hypothetical protein